MIQVEKAWEEYVEGKRNAFGDVYQYYHPRLVFFCYGLCRDQMQAQNFASGSLLKLLEYHPPSEIEKPGQWLFTVARNQFNGWYRQQQTRRNIEQSVLKPTTTTQATVEQLIDRNIYDNKLQDILSESEFQIWDLHRKGYSNEEIATEMNLPYKTVANKKSLIRNQVRQLLKPRS